MLLKISANERTYPMHLFAQILKGIAWISAEVLMKLVTCNLWVTLKFRIEDFITILSRTWSFMDGSFLKFLQTNEHIPCLRLRKFSKKSPAGLQGYCSNGERVIFRIVTYNILQRGAKHKVYVNVFLSGETVGPVRSDSVRESRRT